MPANIASTIDPYLKIVNLKDYLTLKEVRANTCLIGGKIIYKGKEYSEESYNAEYPEPVLKYNIKNADSGQIEK